MTFEFSPELLEYMKSKNRSAVAVTVADTSNSDINVEELHIIAVSEKDAQRMIEKQNYHLYEAPQCNVLLPNYILEYSPTVKFYLKKILCFRLIKSEGISF